MLDRTQIGIGNELQATSNLTGRVSNSLEPRFVHQNQTSNPSKMPDLQTCSARNGQNPGQNPDKPNFKLFQTQGTMNPPKPSKNPKLQTAKKINTNILQMF